MKIGDHQFTEGLCLKCGRRWVDLRLVDETYIGIHGYACRGPLTEAEVPDYIRERVREDAAIEAAFKSLGTGR